MAALKRLDLRTVRAYQIKLALAHFWEIVDPEEAVSYLKRWYFWATHSRLLPVIQAARTIKRYFAKIKMRLGGAHLQLFKAKPSP